MSPNQVYLTLYNNFQYGEKDWDLFLILFDSNYCKRFRTNNRENRNIENNYLFKTMLRQVFKFIRLIPKHYEFVAKYEVTA